MFLSVSQVTNPVVEILVKSVDKFIRNKFHELYGVKSEIEKLCSNLSAIQAALEDAERVLQESSSKSLLDWFTKLRDVALDVEDVLETYATEATLSKKRKFPAPFSWLQFKSEASSKIKKVVGRMDLISREKEAFHFRAGDYVSSNWRPQTARHESLRETSYLRDTSEIIGRDDEKEEIVSWLVSDEPVIDGRVPVLAVVGMGGLGKTTLAQLVYNDPRVYKKKDETCHFKAAMWLNVSTDATSDNILKGMVEILTEMRHDMIPASAIKSRILEVLDGKRFLLVLDDVWPEKLDWEPLYGFLKLCPQGSKVLVTSRNGNVASIMGALRTSPLGLLPEEECWKLFAKRAFVTGEYQTEFEEIGREIIRKCNYLPLAVKAMAGLLRGNRIVHKWERILKNGVWESDMANLRNETPYILPALRLSYDHLPSPLKQCFAYCCLYPKGYMFEKNELVKLWVAQAYILPCGADKIEELGSDYFDELLTRSFFQLLDVDNKKRYKMHDLIHDLAKFVSSRCQQVEENMEVSIETDARHVSFLSKHAYNSSKEIIKAKKLRTLLLPNIYATDFHRVLDKMFRALSYLRVLDLNSSNIKDLPKSIGELKLLRYLDLSRTEIRVLPNTICNLHNLQILKLLQCLWLLELPKELGSLKHLRYLELDEMFWYKTSTLPPRIGRLTNLHNLNSFHIHEESGYGIDELKLMTNLEGILHISNLEKTEDAKSAHLKQKECIHKLVLEWGSQDVDTQQATVQERVLEDLQPHHRLQQLHIIRFKGNRLPSWISNGILHHLNKISLNHCMNCRILSLGELPHLMELRVKGMQELVQWPEMMYPSLSHLSISNCPQLNVLPRFIPNLRAAKIKKCDVLTALPVMPFLMFLRLINNPLLEDFHEARARIPTRNDEGVISFREMGSFMNLLELKIINCPRLQALPQAFFPQKLEISGCPFLQTLPIPQHSQRLQCLQLDYIAASLIEAIPSTSSLYSLIISNVNNLDSLPQFPHLPGLKALHIKNCQDLTSLSLQSLTCLKTLSLLECGKLVSFPNEEGIPNSIECLIIKGCPMLEAFHPRNYMPSLKDLYLEECPKLEFLPEDGLPASLQHLCIRGCPLLSQKYSEDKEGQYWTIIKHIPDLELDFSMC